MAYLFACAIGPVQDFITTARRSRDLWFGSWMLSELSKAVAREIVNQNGFDSLIYPAPLAEQDLELGSLLNVSNKVLATIQVEPAKMGEFVNDALAIRLNDLAQRTFDKIPRDDNCFRRAVAEAQLKDLIEFYWAALPYNNRGEDEYQAKRERVEVLLAMRKNTRNFQQFKGDSVPKSSLDGKRESVIDEKRYPDRNEEEEIRNHKVQFLYQRYGAKPGERLSGVDLLKRLGEVEGDEKPTFHSTSHYACIPFLKKLEKQYGNDFKKELLKEIHSFYKQKNWTVSDIPEDGALLYESRINDSIPLGKDRENLKRELKALLDSKVGDQRPEPYYVLLRADGDSMGSIIDAQTSPEKHHALSQKLSGYAREVKKIVDKHGGSTIFAGGEDILAYAPIHTALACAKELEETFKKSVPGTKFFYTDPETGLTIYPTLSVGMVIVHHLDPLADALELARKAEREAKKIDGKNGLAIILCKRSGMDRMIKGKFEPLYLRLEKMIGFHGSRAISKTTAFDLHELYLTLGKDTIPSGALVQEIERILNKKREAGGEAVLSSEVLDAMKDWMKEKEMELEELSFEMIVAGVLAGAQDLAEGKEQ